MSRRKQAKPQHLKSDEELPPPEGALEHGEGPRGGGAGAGDCWAAGATARRGRSLTAASQCPPRGAGPGRRAAGTGPPLERVARRVADEVNLAQPPGVGELCAGLGVGGRGPRRRLRAAPRAPCGRTRGRSRRPRRSPGGRGGGDACEAHLPLDAGRAALFGVRAPRAVRGRIWAAARTPACPLPRWVRLVRPEAAEPRVPAS